MSLFQANDEKSLPTCFSANEQNLILKARFYPVMLPWQRHTRYLNYQNMVVYSFSGCRAKLADPGISGF